METIFYGEFDYKDVFDVKAGNYIFVESHPILGLFVLFKLVIKISRYIASNKGVLLFLQNTLQVSWVRHRDVHLLTVGRYTYTSDQRFRAIHQPHSEDWTLQIKFIQHRDEGIYECQISSTPHLSHFIHLSVAGECYIFNFIMIILLTLSKELNEEFSVNNSRRKNKSNRIQTNFFIVFFLVNLQKSKHSAPPPPTIVIESN